jgi:alpha-tubulin suppressor-like RCC1 family protein
MMEQNNKVKEAKHSEELEKQEEQEQEQVQKIWSWGAGTDGQLCTGRLEDEHLPQLLHHLHLPPISLLACGGAHVIALTSGTILAYPPIIDTTQNSFFPF